LQKIVIHNFVFWHEQEIFDSPQAPHRLWEQTSQLFSRSKIFIYSPTDAQVNCLKNNSKIYIKIDIKTAPVCFIAVTPSSGSALFVLAKVTVVKITN